MDCWYGYTASLMPKMLCAIQPGAPVFEEGGWADCDGKPSIALYENYDMPNKDLEHIVVDIFIHIKY